MGLLLTATLGPALVVGQGVPGFASVSDTPPFLGGAAYVGPALTSQPIYISLELATNLTGAESYVQSIYQTGSPHFLQFLTPSEYMSEFGPTQSALTSVINWVSANTGTIPSVQFGDQVNFVTTIGVAERMFGISMNFYNYQGQVFFSNSHDVLLPVSISKFVQGVEGLNNATGLTTATQVIEGNTTIIPADVFSYYQFTQAFNYGYGANGETIGIVGYPEQGINLGDVTNFWNTYGIPWTSLVESTVSGGIPGVDTTVGSGSMEMTLDSEWAGSTGQYAKIVVMTDNPPCFFGIGCQSQYTQWYNEMSQIVNSLNPVVMSTSIQYLNSQLSASQISSIHSLMVQSAAQGITVVGASGDYGANVLYDPSSDSYATSVGGVFDTVNANTPGITGQSGWTDSGGGPNTNFAQPGYQSSLAIRAPSNGYRDTPDISFPAWHSIAIYFNGKWVGGYGGTSFATPMFAGLVADSVSFADSRLGQINNIMYDIPYGANGCAFLGAAYTDVTSGNNGYKAGTGWDYVTGIGTPLALNFIYAMDNWVYSPSCRVA